MPLLTGSDLDDDHAIRELQALVDALERGDATIQSLKHADETDVQDVATEQVLVEYTLSHDFAGIRPVQYDPENGGHRGVTGDD